VGAGMSDLMVALCWLAVIWMSFGLALIGAVIFLVWQVMRVWRGEK